MPDENWKPVAPISENISLRATLLRKASVIADAVQTAIDAARDADGRGDEAGALAYLKDSARLLKTQSIIMTEIGALPDHDDFAQAIEAAFRRGLDPNGP